MSTVLVINSGSSSFKYQLIQMATEQVLASGLVERIGEALGTARHTVMGAALGDGPAVAMERVSFDRERPIPDHDAGFQVMLDAFAAHGPSLEANRPVAVGHRVVHGGARFFEPTIVDARTRANIAELSTLAPLHNPANLAGIEAAERVFADVPHVVVFDTAFHQTLPPDAYTYAIDAELAREHHVRRYGFHGTSHKYVSETAAQFLERPLTELRQLVFHLGNGASVCAIDGGRSVETSMGFTPLEGLVMGTRSGDLDPAVLFQLHRQGGLSVDDLDVLLNKRSGLLGLSGRADMRDVLRGRDAGDPAATLAFDVYTHRLRAYAGAFMAQLGGVDVISFTAGVGENAAAVRAAAMDRLQFVGVELDAQRNEARSAGTRVISSDASAVTVLIVPTNEELEIARQTLEAIGARR